MIDEVEIEIAAVAETGQAEVDASISKIDNEETRNNILDLGRSAMAIQLSR